MRRISFSQLRDLSDKEREQLGRYVRNRLRAMDAASKRRTQIMSAIKEIEHADRTNIS